MTRPMIGIALKCLTIAIGCCSVALAGCGSGPGEPESKMTSYTASEKKADTAQSFQITQDQMTHLQIVPVAKENLQRSLRLTGSVAYNSFLTTSFLPNPSAR